MGSSTKYKGINRLLAVALLVLPYLLLLLGYWLNPFKINTKVSYSAPSVTFLFGSDALGRNMLARTLYATGLTLNAALNAVIISFVFGLVLGTLAGYNYRKWPDKLISWITALIFSVPFILWLIGILIVIGGGLTEAFLVIGCFWWVGPARLVRSEVIILRNSIPVCANRALGFSEKYTLTTTILPQVYWPALLSLIYYLPELISLEVGLSFFGLGAKPPTPSLGRLIYEGVNLFYSGWWLSLFPGILLLVSVSIIYLSVNNLKIATYTPK